ncbi:cytochrome b/b6 domain-containing protein [Halothiobacillus sp.]|uniref:cytochrome b/b6 domain-containing protein n=1 Tax=Halothiobacillus sp. TaxID=1891311 RepID=UPI002A3F21E2|nr:cytochrome b/b6 domain-containing protein [Halothiobacillus sp.]
MSSTDKSTRRIVKVWDLPTRLFHWLLVIGIFAMWFTADILDRLGLHMTIGYALIGLIVFRLVWGIIGSDTARFSQFVRHPKHIIAYIKGAHKGIWLGHNPLGALSVLAMIISILVQLGTGLFANDQIYNEGPFSGYVSENTQDLLTYIHDVNFNILLGLIALHLLAIAFYQFKKHEPLVQAMITGKRALKPDETVQNPNLRFAGWLAFVIATIIGVGVWYLVSYRAPMVASWLGLH